MRIVGVTGGVDTHADTHLAAAVDHNGGVLGIDSFLADRAGYEELLGWLVGFGEVEEIGVEGTESWGVGLTRFLHDQEIMVVEVDRPNRQKRRRVRMGSAPRARHDVVHGSLIEAVEEVALGVQGGLDRGVVMPLLDDLWCSP